MKTEMLGNASLLLIKVDGVSSHFWMVGFIIPTKKDSCKQQRSYKQLPTLTGQGKNSGVC